MFRRKEENETDNTVAVPVNPSLVSLSSNNALAPETAATPVATQPAVPTHNPYAPVAARPVPESARPAAPVASAYRPAPIAEFGRTPAAPRVSESRTATSAPVAAPVAHTQNTPSSIHTTEKSPPAKVNRRVLTVGNDILLKGEIATCDRLVIEGRVEAKLSDVHTVEIAECGSFKGTAEVEDAEISGVFEGDLVVRNRIVIYATGEVRGNISYGEIEIERGGRLTGQIKTVSSGNALANGKARPTFEPEIKTRQAAAKEVVAAA